MPTVNTIITSNNNILQKEDIVNRYNMQNGENNSTSVYKRPGFPKSLMNIWGILTHGLVIMRHIGDCP